jgi:thiol-disulfide isomerase/thioredoxin
MSPSKGFFFGLGAGVALTMVALQMWGKYLDRRIVLNANPWIVQPFRQPLVRETSTSSNRLPRPILPKIIGAAPDHWTIHTLGGKPVTLGDFKGKVVFLNFWSTWCGPCIAEMSGIRKLQQSLRNEPVAFLAVTQDDEHSVRLFLQKMALRLPVYLAGNDTPEDFGPQVVPRTFILDGSGREVFRAVGALNWDDGNARKFIHGLEGQ